MAHIHRLIGKAMRLWWKLRRPLTLGVRAIVVDDRDRVALVRHSYVDGWYLPGGGVKGGESIVAAIVRELREEIGLEDAPIERVIGVHHSRKEGKDDHVVTFLVRVDADRAAGLRGADATEIAEMGWFAIDAPPPGATPATLRRIADYRAGAQGLGIW